METVFDSQSLKYLISDSIHKKKRFAIPFSRTLDSSKFTYSVRRPSQLKYKYIPEDLLFGISHTPLFI